MNEMKPTECETFHHAIDNKLNMKDDFSLN